jgi:SAM-dependent methyltransferase
MSADTRVTSREVTWHDVECGSYGADLALWDRLATESGGRVLELGCGTGRVSLHLAARGHDVTGVEPETALAEVASARATARALSLRVVQADARELDLGESFDLVVAPMQVMQLLGGPEGRAQAFAAAREHLTPGGLFAGAVVEGEFTASFDADANLIPDVREEDGWIYSSLPLEVLVERGQLVVRRLRQTVAPSGDLVDELYADLLDVVDIPKLEAEGVAAGLAPAGRLEIAETDSHIGSAVLLLRREGEQ